MKIRKTDYWDAAKFQQLNFVTITSRNLNIAASGAETSFFKWRQTLYLQLQSAKKPAFTCFKFSRDMRKQQLLSIDSVRRLSYKNSLTFRTYVMFAVVSTAKITFPIIPNTL